MVQERADIEAICRVLSRAKVYSTNHPRSVWCRQLVLWIDGQPLVCEVDATSNNGVLLDFESSADVMAWRTSYGTYQSNRLGAVLKALVKD